MAGHSKFKNIMHRKGAQDKKKAKEFTRVLREVAIAAKTGPADPQFNPRLRLAISAARKINTPKDRIENAIKSDNSSQENYEEIIYEGYGPYGVAIIVEALTDNRNRTANEVRSIFSKHGGSLGETGSVSHLFQRLGLITYDKSQFDFNRVFEASIESEANDCIALEDLYEITCNTDQLHRVKDMLESKLGEPDKAELIWRPIITVNLDVESCDKIKKLIDVMEDNDDVQNVISNLV